MSKNLSSRVTKIEASAKPAIRRDDPEVARRMAKYIVNDIFSELYLGHIVYANGQAVVIEPACRTKEALASAHKSARYLNATINDCGFLLPCSFEDWQTTITALESGLFIPAGNEHGRWGLWWADGSWHFADPWRAVQRAKVAIECACTWDGCQLPTDAAGCLEVLRKYSPFSRPGEMEVVKSI